MMLILLILRKKSMNVNVTTGINAVHKLTVCVSGDVRIKIAKGSTQDEHNRIVLAFTKVATAALLVATGTLRGKKHIGNDCPTIKMCNNSQKHYFTFDL